jgi:hypothetical protein
MRLTENTENNPDSATLELWRAAETGGLADVEAALSRVVDINARNEHGVTALMRAAQHGHAPVVRLLLAKGADANIVRNDKFTALSLAAFFGHTEVVRALMEHGADSKASTRSGTSAHMWATARTFNEVVDQLKNPAPPKLEEPIVIRRPTTAPRQVSAPRPVAAPAARPVSPMPELSRVVHTLKDPPEIWDLVHEAPKSFNVRSTFVDHLRSMRLTFRLATAAVLIAACVVGALVLRGVHARSEFRVEQQERASVPLIDAQNKPAETVVQPAVTAPAPASPDFVAAPAATIDRDEFSPATNRVRSSHSRMVRAPRIEYEAAQPKATSESVQKSEASSEKSNAETRPAATPRAPISSPLSPQLITPDKSVTPKKKVIQWP